MEFIEMGKHLIEHIMIIMPGQYLQNVITYAWASDQGWHQVILRQRIEGTRLPGIWWGWCWISLALVEVKHMVKPCETLLLD